MESTFLPNIRSKFVADDGREFELQAFWNDVIKQLDEQTKEKIFKTSRLNRKQCRMLWEWIGRTDPVPKFLRIYLYAKDVERITRRDRRA